MAALFRALFRKVGITVRRAFGFLVVGLIAVVGSDALAGQPTGPTAQSPRVMILGSLHLANPGADDQNVEADDPTSERRQRELGALADRLERFRPDRIAVELPAVYEDSLALWYGEYRRDSLVSIPTSELDQIAFRLAERLGHDRVYPIDHRQGLDLSGVMEYARKHGQASRVPDARRSTTEAVARIEALQSEGTYLDVFRYLNASQWDRTHEFYLVLATVGRGAEYPGAEMAADWYERNLKIFTNVWRLTRDGGDRVLVVIGAGHGTLLRRFVEDSPDLRLVPALDYLGEPADDRLGASRGKRPYEVAADRRSVLLYAESSNPALVVEELQAAIDNAKELGCRAIDVGTGHGRSDDFEAEYTTALLSCPHSVPELDPETGRPVE